MECRHIVLSEITYNGTNYNLLDRYRNSRIKNAIISGEIKGDVVTDDGKILYYKVPLQVGDTFKATDGWFTYHLNDIINNQLAVMDGWDYCIGESTYLDKYPITLFIGVKAHYGESLKMKEYLHRQLIRRMNERGAQDVVKSLLVNSDSLLKKNFARYGITDTGYTFSNKKWNFGKHEIRNLQSVSYRLTRELKILNELNIHYLYETIERFKIECDALINDYNTKKRIGLPEHMVLAEKHMEYYIDSILSEAKSLCNDCGCRNIKYYLAKYSKSTYFRVIYDIMDKVYDTVRKNIHINNYEHYRLCNKYELYNSRIMDLVSNFNDYLEYNDIPDNRFCNHALDALHQYSLDLTTNPNITVDLAHNTVNIQSLLYIDSLNIVNVMIEQIEKWQVLRQQRLQLQKERLAKEREQKKAELDAKKKVGIDKLKELLSQIEEIDDESSIGKLIAFTNCLNTAKALMIDIGYERVVSQSVTPYDDVTQLFREIKIKNKVNNTVKRALIADGDVNKLSRELSKLDFARDKAAYVKQMQKLFGFNKLVTANYMLTSYGHNTVCIDKDKTTTDAYYIGIFGQGIKPTVFKARTDRFVYNSECTCIISNLSKNKDNKLVIKMTTLSKEGIKELNILTETNYTAGKKYGITVLDKVKSYEHRRTYMIVKLDCDVYRLAFDFSGNMTKIDKLPVPSNARSIKAESKITQKNEFLTMITYIDSNFIKRNMFTKVGGNENG